MPELEIPAGLERLRASFAPALETDGPADRLRRALDPAFNAERARELGESLSAADRRVLGLSLARSGRRIAHVVYGCFNCGAIVAGPESTCTKCGNQHGGSAHHRAISR